MQNKPQDDRLVYLIFTAQHGLKLNVKDALLAAGVKVTLVQAGILFLLIEENEQPMSALGRLLSLDKSTITGLIDRLEKAGYVARKADPADRRVFLINITPQGIKQANKASKVVSRINEEIRTSFSAGDIDSLKKILIGLIDKYQKE